MAHPNLSQALGQSGSVAQPEPNQVLGLGPTTAAMSPSVTSGSSGPPPSSSLIKSLLANKVPDNNNPSVNQVANLGLSPTATALPGMTRVSCMNAHASSIPLNTSALTTTTTASSTTLVTPSSLSAAHQQVGFVFLFYFVPCYKIIHFLISECLELLSNHLNLTSVNINNSLCTILGRSAAATAKVASTTTPTNR